MKEETKMNKIKVYSPGSDDMVPVTQEWCDTVQRAGNLLCIQREIVELVMHMRPKPAQGDLEAEKLRKLHVMCTELDLMSDTTRAIIKRDRQVKG